MFRSIIEFWKGKSFLSEILQEFKEMLTDGEAMFRAVCGRLLYGEDQPNLDEKIYKIDERVNDLVRDIRKKIVEHLAIQPSVDVPASLLLMSVVKDAERIGDYAKNLLEVSRFLDKPLDKEKFASFFNQADRDLLELFTATRVAFIDSNEEKAKLSWEYERKIAPKCDKIIEELARSKLSVNEAVCYTLIARYFKRIAAHLTNIASSVILPISDLDYFDEKRRVEGT